MLDLAYRRAWIAGGVLLTALVVVGSLLPAPVIESLHLLPWDKARHALAYGSLTLWFTGLLERSRYHRAGLLSFAVGLLVELAQAALTATRLAGSADLLANGIGAALGLAVAYAGLGGWARHVERWLGVAPAGGR
jgi:VanZ family protein